MSSIFDDSYYAVEDEAVDIRDEFKAKNDDRTNDVDIEKVEQTEELPIGVKEGAPGDWWICDGCGEGIAEGHWHFDCMECANFTLCSQCRTTVVHEHRLKKLKVPIGCKPPDQIVHIMCDICNADITKEERYDCSKCKDFSVCEGCLAACDHPHELKPATADLWEEYYSLNYEDLVAGVPCRFKYQKVEPNDYGLTDDVILRWEDKTLNQLVSLKKLSTYRTDGGKVNESKLRRKFKFLKQQRKSRRHQPEASEVPDTVSSRMQSYGLDKA
jgi:protein KRI1